MEKQAPRHERGTVQAFPKKIKDSKHNSTEGEALTASIEDESTTHPHHHSASHRRSSKELAPSTLSQPLLSPLTNIPQPCHQQDVQSKENQQQQLQSFASPYRPPTPKHFNVLSLRPLQSKASLKKKYVQLYCKGNHVEILCFRGSSDAAFALGIDRKIISKMCERTKKGDLINDAQDFDSFSLGYASNRIIPRSYQYGIHPEDWKAQEDETEGVNNGDKDGVKYVQRSGEAYYERLARWEKTFLKERERERNHNAHLALHENPPTKEVPIKNLSSIAITSLHPNTLVTALRPSQLLNDNLDNGDMCVICQETKAQIVFEPCQHCLICAQCFKNGLCHKFCPSCRTNILSTSQPAFLKLVRPRIFSAHLFM